MTDQEILAKFTSILRDLLLDDSIELTMETRREDVPNWDSFNYINFIVAVEIEFGVKFKIADIESVSGAETVDTAALYGGRYEDIPRRIPDSTKAQRELGWRLQVDVEEGIRRTIDWARANSWYLEGPKQ